jgi:hypothetical protein
MKCSFQNNLPFLKRVILRWDLTRPHLQAHFSVLKCFEVELKLKGGVNFQNKIGFRGLSTSRIQWKWIKLKNPLICTSFEE